MPPKTASKPKSKSKKVPTIGQMLKAPIDLDALLAPVVAAPPETPPSPSKRRSSAISISSTEQATPVEKKTPSKKAKVVPPRPGTPEFERLGPVTLAHSPPDFSSSTTATPSSARPKRRIVKTPKALASGLDPLDFDVDATPKPKPKTRLTKKPAFEAESPLSVNTGSTTLEDKLATLLNSPMAPKYRDLTLKKRQTTPTPGAASSLLGEEPPVSPLPLENTHSRVKRSQPARQAVPRRKVTRSYNQFADSLPENLDSDSGSADAVQRENTPHPQFESSSQQENSDAEISDTEDVSNHQGDESMDVDIAVSKPVFEYNKGANNHGDNNGEGEAKDDEAEDEAGNDEANDDEANDDEANDDEADNEDKETENPELDEVDGECEVTHEMWQDPDLRERKFYDNLPNIPNLFVFRAYHQTKYPMFTHFMSIKQLMTQFDGRAILSVGALLRFTRFQQYVNMSRADPVLFSNAVSDPALVSKGLIVKFAEGNGFPVGLMALSVQESFLRSPGTFGTSSLPVYKLSGIPFCQEFRREVSLWCGFLGFSDHEIVGPVGPYGVTFQTKTPPKNTSTQVSHSEPPPSKNTVRMPVMTASNTSRFTGKFTQPAHPYEKPVPIFDGRGTPDQPPFMFTDTDFAKISKLPRFRGGEIPHDSLAVVGYTWTTYDGANGASLSSNLLFVILIGSPL